MDIQGRARDVDVLRHMVLPVRVSVLGKAPAKSPGSPSGGSAFAFYLPNMRCSTR